MIIGLTGGIGSGKSTVGEFLKELGAEVIDADEIAQAYLQKKWIQEKIVRSFGKGILNFQGNIHKKKLAELAFKNSKKLKKLEGFLHPWVIQEIRKKIHQARKDKRPRPWVIIVPLLFETHLEDSFERIIVVTSPKRLRIQRASKKLKIPASEVRERMNFQLDPRIQLKKADFVIKNNGTKRKLRHRARKLFLKLEDTR